MKCILVLVFVISALCFVSSRSIPGRNGMIFYQSAPEYYNPGSHQQRAMYVQYGSPYKLNRRSNYEEEGGVAAFAAGDTIAAGTYLKDCKTTETDLNNGQAEVKLDDHDDEHVSSVAEAYPEQFPLNNNEHDVPTVDEEEFNGVVPHDEHVAQNVPHHKTPKELVPEEEVPAQNPESESEHAPANVPVLSPSESPVQASVPALQKPAKKVHVELDTADDDDEFIPYHTQVKAQPNVGNVPANSYFPINFGSTSGGAIAIANSFSTGKGGTASSTATAYGSPSKPRTKKRLVESQ